MQNKVTEKEKNLIRYLHSEGYSDGQIGRMINRNPSTVTAQRKRMSIPAHPRNRSKLTTAEIQYLRFEKGLTVSAIAKEAQINQSSVKKHLKK